MGSLERQCVRLIMGQRISCVKKVINSRCVYNSHLSTPQSSANTPHPHHCEERHAGSAEEDEGERKRVMRKKGRFWRGLACFSFSRPRVGQDRKAQSEKLEQTGSSRCSTDGISLQRYVNIHRIENCK